MPTGIYKRIKPVWNKGKTISEKTKKKISKAKKGRRFTEEHKKKIGLSNKGKKLPPQSKEHKRKLSLALRGKNKGEKSYFWKGGISFEPYSLEFNNDLREVVRNRDRRKCQLCGKTELEEGKKLSVHHIDYDKKNCNPNNLITLCNKCHIKTNHNREKWKKYFLLD
jgi:5-methylcytosine-specific restriction endonuclease McrA